MEVKRVEEIMNSATTELVEKTRLEGQKRLEKALMVARVRFDKEKRECVKDAIGNIQCDFDVLIEKERESHRENVDELNKSWKIKTKVCSLYKFRS